MIWLLATFLTPAENEETLKNFVKVVNPGGPGWKKFEVEGISNTPWAVPSGIISMLFGCFFGARRNADCFWRRRCPMATTDS